MQDDAETVVDLFHTLRREKRRRSIFGRNATSLFQGPPSPPAAPPLVITETGGIPEGKREALYVSRLTTDDADVLDITFLIWRYLGLPRLGIFHLLVEGF